MIKKRWHLHKLTYIVISKWLTLKLARALTAKNIAIELESHDSRVLLVERASTAPLAHLLKRHGRFKTAVLCSVVENVACPALLHTYGLHGAIEHTLPLLGARLQDTCFAVYIFTLNCLLFLVMKAALKFKNPALQFSSLFIPSFASCLVRNTSPQSSNSSSLLTSPRQKSSEVCMSHI